MKPIVYLLIILIVIMSGSCTDFLDENPRSFYTTENFYQNETDARMIINGIYRSLNDPDVVGVGIRPLTTDLYKRNNWSNENGLGDYTYNASNNFFLRTWQKHYSIINMCNLAIEYITLNKDNIENHNRYIAQAKGIRAYLYFDLVRWFGDVPLVLKPIEEFNQSSVKVFRSPSPDVFSQIIDDFNECASNSMPKDSVHLGYQYGRMTQEAAHGFLAKVYLWMASIGQRDNSELYGKPADNYLLSLNHAKTVIDSRKFRLTQFYPDLFTISSETNAREEIVFGVQALRGEGTGTTTGMYFGITGGIAFGGSYGNIISTNYHRMIYEPGDSIRRMWNCPRASISGSGILSSYDYDYYLTNDPQSILDRAREKNHAMPYCIGKFRRFPVVDINSYSTLDGMDEPLLRYADILLIYAEAFNEVNIGPGTYSGSSGRDFTGNSSMSAYDAVNLIRKRARTYNTGLVHQNIYPRVYNLSKSDLTTECVPDWKPGFYGYLYDGTTPVYSSRDYVSDFQAFREEILWERGRELVAETNDRWCDLVRRNKLVTQIKALRSTLNPFITANEKLNPVDAPENIKPHMMLFPIPQGEIDVNRNLTQNPNY